MKILYIAGYGRSGSTVLATVLGNHPDIASVGEIGFGIDDLWDASRRCSCGQAYTSCPFWSDLVAGSPPEPEVLGEVRAVDRLAVSPTHWLRGHGGERRAAYRGFHRRLFDHVLLRSGASVVVDSSKSARLTTRRPLALHRIAGHEVYVLHLLRDGRTTLRSLTSHGSNWVLEGHRVRYRFAALRAASGWVWTNLYAASLRRALGRDRYLRMRFEDFVTNPIEGLRRIGELLDLDMEPLFERLRNGGTFHVGHMVGGNRMRFQSTVSLTAGGVTSSELPPGQRLLFAVIGGLLNRHYGYEHR